MSEWINARKDEWKDEWKDELINIWMKKWKNEYWITYLKTKFSGWCHDDCNGSVPLLQFLLVCYMSKNGEVNLSIKLNKEFG